MALAQKTQKNPIYERIFLSVMTLHNFCSLVADKAKKLVFRNFQKRVKIGFLAFSATRGQK